MADVSMVLSLGHIHEAPQHKHAALQPCVRHTVLTHNVLRK